MPWSMKAGILRDRHRDVVAEARPFGARGLGHAFADAPHVARLRLVLADHGIEHAAGFHLVGEELLHLLRHALGAVGLGPRRRPFEQQEPRRVGLEGSCMPGMWRSTMSVAARLISSHEPTLSSDAAWASDRISMAACGSRMASQAVATSLGAGHSFSTALVMTPERALGAHEQMLEVVAGIVLLERAQAVPDLAVGQHDFEAQHEVAGVAVAQHLHAAGIGREIAADHARALGAQAEREEAVVARGRLLQGLQDAARLDRHGIADRIDLDAPGSCGRATARCRCGSATAWRRPSGRYCRPGARWRCRCRSRVLRPWRLPRCWPGARRRPRCRSASRASRSRRAPCPDRPGSGPCRPRWRAGPPGRRASPAVGMTGMAVSGIRFL